MATKSSGFLFSGRAGVAMQRVMLCLTWVRLRGKGCKALPIVINLFFTQQEHSCMKPKEYLVLFSLAALWEAINPCRQDFVRHANHTIL